MKILNFFLEIQPNFKLLMPNGSGSGCPNNLGRQTEVRVSTRSKKFQKFFMVRVLMMSNTNFKI